MKINKTIGNAGIQIAIDVDTSRIEDNLREAQKLLNEQIVADCDTLITFQQGGLKNSVWYPQGIYGGEIEWNTPYAHYQHEGILYLTEDGRSFADRYEKKFPTDKQLQYHTPGTTDHWVEEAEKEHKKDWVDLVRRTVGKE